MQMKKIRGLGCRLAAVAVLAGLGACDNPVENREEHAEGLLIVNAQGQQVASYDAEEGKSSGTLSVSASGSQTYRVFLTTEDGDRITPGRGEYTLGSASVLLVTLAGASIQGANQLVLTGKAPGNTSVVIPVLHGGHTDFTATILVSVTQ